MTSRCTVHRSNLRGMNTFRRGNSTFYRIVSCLPSEKRSTLEGKNLLKGGGGGGGGANSFLLEQTPFLKGFGVQEHNQKIN